MTGIDLRIVWYQIRSSSHLCLWLVVPYIVTALRAAGVEPQLDDFGDPIPPEHADLIACKENPALIDVPGVPAPSRHRQHNTPFVGSLFCFGFFRSDWH